MSVIERAEEIFYDDDHMIFIIHGEDNKLLIEALEELTNTAEIPKIFIEKNDDDERPTIEYLDNITVRMMASNLLYVILDNFDNLSGGKMIDLVHGYFFMIYDSIIGYEPVCKRRKLIIFTNLNPDGSIFTTERALHSRCKFMNMV